MFRKVAQGFTNAATKPGCLGPFQRSLPQQESALPNAYESNDRNVTGLSYKKNTTKVQQLETFPTQYIGASKFLFGRIPAGGSSGIAKPSLGGDVQFKKLRDIARLDPALCHSESQPVGFGASQQTVKSILAEGEKSDILSGIWGLMQNPISHSFREGEMVNENEQDADKSQQLETLKGENEKLKDENQQLEVLKNANEELKTKLQGSESKNKELESKVQDLQTQLKSENEELKTKLQGSESKIQKLEELKSENEELKTKLQEFEKENKELESQIQDLQTQLEGKDEELKDENNNLKTKLRESESKIQELESRVKELEVLKSANESQIKDLQEQLESKNKEMEDDKNSKPPAVNVQGVKSKVNYASVSFMLSWVCVVGASLATPYLAICATLAVAASVFLALGCYCLYKANTTLSNVEVDQQDNQQLLESSL